tara:strand:+ start:714 stop:821 length:108 start_codon:yes stop_codon:yes gene_type:complete
MLASTILPLIITPFSLCTLPPIATIVPSIIADGKR